MKPIEYLKSGCIVQTRSGEYWIVVEDEFGKILFLNKEGWLELGDYDENLIDITNSWQAVSEYDITAIYEKTFFNGSPYIDFFNNRIDKMLNKLKLTWKDESGNIGVRLCAVILHDDESNSERLYELPYEEGIGYKYDYLKNAPVIVEDESGTKRGIITWTKVVENRREYNVLLEDYDAKLPLGRVLEYVNPIKWGV